MDKLWKIFIMDYYVANTKNELEPYQVTERDFYKIFFNKKQKIQKMHDLIFPKQAMNFTKP